MKGATMPPVLANTELKKKFFCKKKDLVAFGHGTKKNSELQRSAEF
jgi:hypothetical protein